MLYSKLVEVYQRLEKTTKKLEKTYIISELIKNTKKEDMHIILYLLQGRVFAPWDERKLGMSSMLVIKAIGSLTGLNKKEIEELWKEKGDLGEVIEILIKKNKQKTLFSQELTIQKVFANLQKLSGLEGKGTVSKKIQYLSELLTNAKQAEAKYIVKTVLEELRVGVAEGILRDAITWTFFPKIAGVFFKCGKCGSYMPAITKCLECGEKLDTKFKNELKKKHSGCLKVIGVNNLKDFEEHSLIMCYDEKEARKIYNEFINKVQSAYDLSNDFGLVALTLRKHGIKGLATINMEPGNPINSMLSPKVENIEEGFKCVGKPAQMEYKLDGFRVQIHKNGKQFKLFTRNLEDVTRQFKELIPIIDKNIKGKSFILDSELVGYNSKTKKYMPFQHISQRIRRKYDIEKIAKNVPVEINIFDILFYEGSKLINKTLEQRRKIIESIVTEVKHKIALTKKILTSDKKEAESFYKESLEMGNEGLMLKNLKGKYIPGKRVRGWVKLKPTKENLDLVVVGAEWGEGKRANWLSSYKVACRDGDAFLEVGKVSTGVKEKDQEGATFRQITEELKPLILEEKGRYVRLKPKVVIEVAYEEVQKSPTYDSGFALRFPRVISIRFDKSVSEIATIDEIKKAFDSQKKD